LDMHLVRGIDQDRKRQAIARHGAALALELGIAVIAEGIETADESRALQDLGIDLQQGYLFARPQLDGLAPIHWPA
ncbi:MAG: EAL domain-containing protein, partial [Sphingobium sp.]